MNVRRIQTVLALPLLLAVSSCLSMATNLTSPAMPRQTLDTYSLQEGQLRSAAGCQFDYRIYEPDKPRSSTSVILGHGFLRDQDTLVDLGRALANEGIIAITLDFCNMRPWNGHHKRNAADMQLLARALARNDVIYAGFSAGALAALLAAVPPPDAPPNAPSGTPTDKQVKTQQVSPPIVRAVVALDLVDQADLGVTAARRLQVPLLGLRGPPSSCNAYNNTQPVFDALADSARKATTPATVKLIPGASHCEFESPSNWLCETACGDNDPPENDALTRQQIIKQTLALVLSRLN